MFNQRINGAKEVNGLVAVAVDTDKGTNHSLKWAAENLIPKTGTLILIHVLHKSPSHSGVRSHHHSPVSTSEHLEKPIKDLFLNAHCLCTRKNIQSFDVILEDSDIVKALTEYVSYAVIENLVFAMSSKNAFLRKFKASSIPNGVSRNAPDFCTVYVIYKGKISAMRSASHSAPHISPLLSQIEQLANKRSIVVDHKNSISHRATTLINRSPTWKDDKDSDRSVNNIVLGSRDGEGISGSETDMSYTDISFVSSSRPSTDLMSPIAYDYIDSLLNNGKMSTSTDQSFGTNYTDHNSLHDLSFVSHDSGRTSCSSRGVVPDEVAAHMRRLELELKRSHDLYNAAVKEAVEAKQKVIGLQRLADERGIGELDSAPEVSTALAENLRAQKNADEMKKMLDMLRQNNVRYKTYDIEEIRMATDGFAESRKIGEGGYGPVFMCSLDNTPVAVKVLRPDAAQGMLQFQQEIEVLSCIRHPNMVLLVGACPEYGCLVYEYMANGSLDDRLLQRNNTAPLSWRLRFRIAAEIATGLLFLHNTKPEPLVHRDLKPANILLDHNFTSKIGDVGLARLVPSSLSDVTQYRMTSTAGTFCYIDPEYQQTGMLGTRSDVYSLGIVFLQLITAKPAMGITHYVREAMERGELAGFVDQAVTDWPMEEVTCFAKMALQCAELRRKDRPDLRKEVLPELNRLRGLADVATLSATIGGPLSEISSASVSQALQSEENL